MLCPHEDSTLVHSLGSLEIIFDQFWAMPYTDVNESLFKPLETSIREPLSVPAEPEVAPNFKKSVNQFNNFFCSSHIHNYIFSSIYLPRNSLFIYSYFSFFSNITIFIYSYFSVETKRWIK